MARDMEATFTETGRQAASGTYDVAYQIKPNEDHRYQTNMSVEEFKRHVIPGSSVLEPAPALAVYPWLLLTGLIGLLLPVRARWRVGLAAVGPAAALILLATATWSGLPLARAFQRPTLPMPPPSEPLDISDNKAVEDWTAGQQQEAQQTAEANAQRRLQEGTPSYRPEADSIKQTVWVLATWVGLVAWLMCCGAELLLLWIGRGTATPRPALAVVDPITGNAPASPRETYAEERS
jgi:hypothetical protein